jgi:hypothetical protein
MDLFRGLNQTNGKSMNSPPVDRALIIYADRSVTKGARERLSEHLMKMYSRAKKTNTAQSAERLVVAGVQKTEQNQKS